MANDESRTTAEMFPKSRQLIADAIEEAIFDAFGMEPPASNSRPIKNAPKPKPPVMSMMQRICLDALAGCTRPDGEMCVGFKRLEKLTELHRVDVRRSVRALARKGWAEFHKGLCTEDGEFAGAGYCISNEGRRIANVRDD